MFDVNFETSMVGKVFSKIEMDRHQEFIIFSFEDGSVFKMGHNQECCEKVYLEDIVGDITKMIGQTVISASHTSDGDLSDDGVTVIEYNFYTIQGNLDSITLRWYGETNSCYSINATLYRLRNEVR